MKELFLPIPPPCLLDFSIWAAGGPLVDNAGPPVWLLGQYWRWALNHNEFLGLLQPWCLFVTSAVSGMCLYSVSLRLLVKNAPCYQKSLACVPFMGTVVQNRPCGQLCFPEWMVVCGPIYTIISALVLGLPCPRHSCL